MVAERRRNQPEAVGAQNADVKRREREKALDQALEDTFPASDPVAATEPAASEE